MLYLVLLPTCVVLQFMVNCDTFSLFTWKLFDLKIFLYFYCIMVSNSQNIWWRSVNFCFMNILLGYLDYRVPTKSKCCWYEKIFKIRGGFYMIGKICTNKYFTLFLYVFSFFSEILEVNAFFCQKHQKPQKTMFEAKKSGQSYIFFNRIKTTYCPLILKNISYS